MSCEQTVVQISESRCDGRTVASSISVNSCCPGQRITVISPVPQCDTDFHYEIVALKTVDGTPSLEGLDTTVRSVTCTKITIVIDVAGQPEEQVWQLLAGTADPMDDGQLAPADYDVVTNQKFWEKVG